MNHLEKSEQELLPQNLNQILDAIYEVFEKTYEVLDKSGIDARTVELLNDAQNSDSDEAFIAEYLTMMRNTMDQWFHIIGYLRSPVLYEGRLKSISRGRYALNGNELKELTQLEYIDLQGRWQFGILKRNTENGKFGILNTNMKPVEITLDDLRVRIRQKIV